MELSTYSQLDGFGRRILSLSLASLDEFPADIAFPSPHFACLLVCDATDLPDEVLTHLAEVLLEKGLAYLCAWGPGCSWVHDLFDLTNIRREIEQGVDYPIMTSWHSKESLDDALWFMLNVAYPDDAYAETCGCSFAIIVGNADWADQVKRRLTNLHQLTLDVVGDSWR